MTKRVFLTVVAFALLSLQVAEARVYKWLDEKGRVQYSQHPPPPGTKVEIIEPRTGKPMSEKTTSEKEEKAEPAADDEKEATAEGEEAKEKEESVAKSQTGNAKNCEIAQKNLATLESGQRVQAQDKEGNPYFLDDAQREQQLESAREQIKTFCN